MPPVRQGNPSGNTAPDDEHRAAACLVAGGLGPIRASLKLFLEAGGVAELRVPHTTRGTVSGYFDDPDKLAEAAGAWSGKAPGVYVTANPVKRDLLARAHNRIVEYAKHATSDTDIVARQWLLIDFDPVRPSGISSTNAEHEAALARARECRDCLRDELGAPAAALVLGDSGNGGHVLIRIDLPNDDASRQLVEQCLSALAFMFDDDHVKVDVGVGNAARIWKLYGTRAAKGDSTTDRPHRLARILEAPTSPAGVPRELLGRLASRAPRSEAGTARSTSNSHFDLETWIGTHARVLHVVRSGAWNSGQRWVLNPCPWNPEHTNGAAYIVQFASGAIAAGCHHNGCAGKNWRSLRDLAEPGWRDSRAPGTTTGTGTAGGDEVEFFSEDRFIPARLGALLVRECAIGLGHDRRLWRYERGVYRSDGDDWARQRTRELVGERFRRNHLEEVRAYLRAQLPTLGHAPPEKFINCTNGLLEWRTAVLHPHSPHVLTTNQIAVAWKPEAVAPRFESFLREVLPDDAVDLVEELVGYALYPGNPFRKAVMLLGPGGNGKSVLLRLITALLANENVAAVPLQALGEDRFSAVDLFGKLANICGDLDARAIQRTDLFKQVTGGDPIRAQHKFRDAFSFVSYALPFFSANEAPRTADQTDAWFDRWIIVPMERRFEGTPEDDPDLSVKLTAELEGILVRAVAGLQRLIARRRFVFPPSVERARERYRQTLDTVRAFVTEECHFDRDEWVDRADLYRRYKEWCRDGGRYDLAATTFNARLLQAYPGTVSPRIRRGRPGWLGLAIGGVAAEGDAGDEGDGFDTLTNRVRAHAHTEGNKSGNGVTPVTPPAPESSADDADEVVEWRSR